MVNYHDRQNDYEDFRLKAKQFLPGETRLPRGIGNHFEITFLSFDENWQPREHHLEYFSRLGWIFRRRVVDLKSTLAPYLEANAMIDERGRLLPAEKD